VKKIVLVAMMAVVLLVAGCASLWPEPPIIQATPAPIAEPTLDITPMYVINIAGSTTDGIIITSGALVTDFKFFVLGFCDENIYFYEGEILHSQGELLPEEPFLIDWEYDRGISFVDHHNRRRYFFIAEDIEEGAIALVEFEPGVSIVSG